MIDFFLSQYKTYPTIDIILEISAMMLGIWSVLCAKKDSVLVFPTGMISTSIYVYLLWKWTLWGDMLINGYYFIMSIYGWYYWSRGKSEANEFPISKTSPTERWMAVLLFAITLAFVIFIYRYFDKFNNWYVYVDTFVTGVFFVGMWLMAKRKIENWLFWLVGNLVSIPLYFAKGFAFTCLQYIIFTIIAFYGYLEWEKKLLNQNN